MKISALALLGLASLGLAGKAPDTKPHMDMRCEPTFQMEDDREGAIEQLKRWCDLDRKVKERHHVSFRSGNTTAFVCVWRGAQGCNSEEAGRFFDAMKRRCPGTQGASGYIPDWAKAYGWYGADVIPCNDGAGTEQDPSDGQCTGNC